MIRFQGVSIWREEWGDPTRLVLAAVLAACFGAGFLKIADSGRVGWPGDALFADRIDDPVKFHAILFVIGVLGLTAVVVLASTAWDLVATWRRDSGWK